MWPCSSAACCISSITSLLISSLFSICLLPTLMLRRISGHPHLSGGLGHTLRGTTHFSSFRGSGSCLPRALIGIFHNFYIKNYIYIYIYIYINLMLEFHDHGDPGFSMQYCVFFFFMVPGYIKKWKIQKKSTQKHKIIKISWEICISRYCYIWPPNTALISFLCDF